MAPKTYDGEKTASSTNAAGKSGYPPKENWNWIHTYQLYYYQLKVD
jgi:hypothetical protein